MRDLERDERRLRRIFRRAAWLAAAAPALGAGACVIDEALNPLGTGTSAATHTAEGGHDAGDAGVDAPDGGGECALEEVTPDPPDPCGAFVRLPCGLPPNTLTAACVITNTFCAEVCPSSFFSCHAIPELCVDGGIVTDSEGGVTVDCATCPGSAGRIPAGLQAAHPLPTGGALGEHFARAAHLEAASVHAFGHLGRELGAHGAPAHLRAAADRARRDEVRHARSVARLARRFGGAPMRARVARTGVRSLDAFAIENAVEGCVRETFGALVASFQALHAADRAVARLMTTIARDETRHAALAWAILRWSWPRLDAAARTRLVRACRAALVSLRRQAAGAVDPELVHAAGVPDPARCRSLLTALEQLLWSAAPTHLT